MVLHALHLCSGYGGFELALRLAGVPARTVAHVERDAYAAATLVARMEEAHLDQAPIWSDLCTFDPGPWAGRVDIVTAGFPCQPFSSAGRQRGTDDERWLWPAIGRLIGDVGPRFVFLENVPGLVRAGLPHVLSDLAQLGFDAEWGLFSAAEVGAPHQRERFWLLAHADIEAGRRPSGLPIDRDGDEAAVGGSTEPRRLGGRLADAERRGWCPAVGDDDARQPDDARGRSHVGHSGGSGRPEVTGGASCDEAACVGSEAGCCGDVADGASEAVANTDGDRRSSVGWCRAGHERDPHGCSSPARQWPPGRDDHTGWADWIAAGGPEPAVRRGTDGRPPELADALHLGGNGLVPAVAAAALVELAHRLGADLWGGNVTGEVA